MTHRLLLKNPRPLPFAAQGYQAAAELAHNSR
jgi:hypothetical protein